MWPCPKSVSLIPLRTPIKGCPYLLNRRLMAVARRMRK